MHFGTRTLGVIAGLAGLICGATQEAYGEQKLLDVLAPVFIPQAINQRALDLQKKGKISPAEAENLRRLGESIQRVTLENQRNNAIRDSATRIENNITVNPQTQQPGQAPTSYPAQPQARVLSPEEQEWADLNRRGGMFTGTYAGDFNENNILERQEIVGFDKKSFKIGEKFKLYLVRGDLYENGNTEEAEITVLSPTGTQVISERVSVAPNITQELGLNENTERNVFKMYGPGEYIIKTKIGGISKGFVKITITE